MIYGSTYNNSFVEFEKAEEGATSLRVLDKVPVFGNIPINREYTFFNTSLGAIRSSFKMLTDIGYKGLDDDYIALIAKEKRNSLYGEFGMGSTRPTSFVPQRISDLRYNSSCLNARISAIPPIADLFALIMIIFGGIPSNMIALMVAIAVATIVIETLVGYGFFTSGRALQYMKYTRYEYTFKSIDGDSNGRIINRTKFLIDEGKREVSKKIIINSFDAKKFWNQYASNNSSFASRHYGVSGPSFLSFPSSYNEHKYKELNEKLNKFLQDKKKIIEKLQINIPQEKRDKFFEDEKDLIDKVTKTDIAGKSFFIDVELDNCVSQRYANPAKKKYIINPGTFLDISPTTKGKSGKALKCGTGQPAILKLYPFHYLVYPRGIFVFNHASSIKSYNTGFEPEGTYTFEGSMIQIFSTWLNEFFFTYIPAIRRPGVVGGFIEIEKRYRRANIFADYPDAPIGHKFGILISKNAPLYK